MKKVKHPYDKVYSSVIQEFTPDNDVKYDAVWIQFVTMYLSDDDFIKFLEKMRSRLNEDSLIFIKENFVAGHKTKTVESEYKGYKDNSL